MARQKMSDEERKEKKRESSARYRLKNKEKSKEYQLKNKDRLKEQKAKYQKENKAKIKEYDAEYYKKNKIKINEQTMIYYKENKDKIKEHSAKYYTKNKETFLTRNESHRKDLKYNMFNILGKRCMICGEDRGKYLTFDHVHNDGGIKRKKFGHDFGELRDFKNRNWPAEEIKLNFQVLCWNHNLGKCREYLNENPLDLDVPRRYRQKLWRQAFDFFGPCKECGETNLQFLTIDHIHNDGAERRRNGEKDSSSLLALFRKQGWPESLKEDYQILCFNHNCAKNLKGEES